VHGSGRNNTTARSRSSRRYFDQTFEIPAQQGFAAGQADFFHALGSRSARPKVSDTRPAGNSGRAGIVTFQFR
jgi:hypothetical protein